MPSVNRRGHAKLGACHGHVAFALMCISVTTSLRGLEAQYSRFWLATRAGKTGRGFAFRTCVQGARLSLMHISARARCRVAFKGALPQSGLKRDTRYQWRYIFGAVCPGRATAAGLVLPFANTEAMNAHLTGIACTVAEGAGWHGSAALTVPDNITLLHLPALFPRTEPGRKRLGLSARQQTRHHRLRHLRRHRQCLLQPSVPTRVRHPTV